MYIYELTNFYITELLSHDSFLRKLIQRKNNALLRN